VWQCTAVSSGSAADFARRVTATKATESLSGLAKAYHVKWHTARTSQGFMVAPRSLRRPNTTTIYTTILYNPVYKRRKPLSYRAYGSGIRQFRIDGHEVGGTAALREEAIPTKSLNRGASRIVVVLDAAASSKFVMQVSDTGDLRAFRTAPACLLPQAHIDDYPTVTITNGLVTAKVAVPDVKRGFYRGNRFEQAGFIISLTSGGHTYFKSPDKVHDPVNDDRAAGPCEEFFNAIAYDDAKRGEPFIKIGVGLYEKPNMPKHLWANPYWPVRVFPWATRVSRNIVTFTQTVTGPRGWGYRYVKRIVLVPNRHEMVIEHAFRNTGSHQIDAAQYNHNWVSLDNIPTTAGYSCKLPFTPTITRNFPPDVAADGNSILIRSGGSNNFGVIGFSRSPSDTSAIISANGTAARLLISGDYPLAGVDFFYEPDAFCYEPTVSFSLKPGQRYAWTRTYRFLAP
jgi:hypothetical protein